MGGGCRIDSLKTNLGFVLRELTYHLNLAVRAILAIGSRDCPRQI